MDESGLVRPVGMTEGQINGNDRQVWVRLMEMTGKCGSD